MQLKQAGKKSVQYGDLCDLHLSYFFSAIRQDATSQAVANDFQLVSKLFPVL